MRLEQLQAFLSVAETGSFQKAARLQCVTQSTISRQVRALEETTGMPLLHRTTPARLTVAGERLFPRVRKICDEWAQGLQEVTDLVEGKQTELCVAAIHSVCSNFLPIVLQKFHASYSDVQLRVTSLGSDRALKVLRDGLVDIAVVMNNPLLTAGADLAIEPLYEESVMVLMAADHPLTNYVSIPKARLAQYNHIIFKDGYGMQRLVHDVFASEGIELRAMLELNTLDAFRGVVRQSEAIAILPASATLEADDDPGLAVRPIATDSPDDPNLTRQVVLVTTLDRLSIPPVRDFYRLVRQHLPQLASDRIAELPTSTLHCLNSFSLAGSAAESS
ncbi:MAG: LysR family transcriptional regulator [Geitlerinemataceae cyanobacterium]